MNKKGIQQIKCLFTFILSCVCALSLTTASAQTKTLSIRMQNVRMGEVMNEIEKQTKYLFVYNSDVDINRVVSINAESQPLERILERLTEGSDITFEFQDLNIILSRRQMPKSTSSSVTGLVTDTAGVPVVGAAVVVKGTTVGTSTGSDGSFTLQVPAPSEKAVITVNFLGYEPVEIIVGKQTRMKITLQESSVAVDQVVVTALGIRKEAKSLSYNVQKVDGNAIANVTDANFVNNLNGKIAGVTINSSSTGTGGASRVVMRGTKSISGNNNALYVIDGVPMPSLSTGQAEDIYAGAGQSGDALSLLNPDDIESLSVLSGPSAAALYGSSAANGVVMITTKKGNKDRLSVTLNNNTTFSRPFLLPQFQNRYGVTEQGSYYSWGGRLSQPSSYDPADFFQTGVNATTSVSLSTGNERNQTYFSAGNVTAEGIIHNNEYDRYTFSFRNTTNFLNDRMTLDVGANYSLAKEQNMVSQGLYSNPIVPLYLFPPGDDFERVQVYERYSASRNFKTQWWPYGSQGLSLQNPYWITERNLFQNTKNRYMLNASLRYEILDWLHISARAKLDKTDGRYEQKYYASTELVNVSKTGYYSLQQIDDRQIYGDVLLSINKYFADNRFSLTANIGASIEDYSYNDSKYGGRLHGVPNLFTYDNVNTSTAERAMSGYHRQKQAVYASAQLGYKGMLYLDVTARNDWASTLAGSNIKSFFYPSVGLSAIVTDMIGLKSKILPYLKLRVSYSEVGNEPDPFLTIPTYSMANGYPVTQTRMPNTDLRPERTKSWEVGLNAVLFDNHLKVDATYYTSRTYNQFFEPTLSSTTTFTSIVVNAGRVDNHGVELTASLDETFGKLQWNSTLTWSLNRNKVVELLRNYSNPLLSEPVSLTQMDMGGTGSYMIRLKEGGSMGDIYVNTLKTDEHGAIYVHPENKTIEADANNFIYAGNAAPRYNLGWGNTFRLHGVTLGFQINARVGGIVVSNTQAIMDAFGVSKASADARDAGGVMINGYRIPAQNYYSVVGSGTSGVGSQYVYSATNVRLGELTLGYDIPVQKWCKWIKGLNVSFVGRNLWMIYNRAPFDPELTANTGTYYQGIDYFMQPSLRNLGFSIKVQF